MAGIRFGCGEFVPGGEPITVDPIQPPDPPILIPTGPGTPKIPVLVPDPPIQDKWKCVRISPGDPEYQPPNPGFRYVNGYWKCRKCDGIGPNPPSNDPECIHFSLDACMAACPSPQVPIREGGGPGEVVPPGDVVPPGPRGGTPTTGGPTTTGTTPTTGAGSVPGYLCQQMVRICPEDVGLPQSQQRILSVSHQCVRCSPYNQNHGTSLSATTTPKVVGNSAVYFNRTACAFRTPQECDAACPPGPITTGNFVTTCERPNVSVLIPDPIVNTSVRPVNVLEETNQSSGGRPISVNVVNVSLDPSIETSQATVANTPQTEVYDNSYNFFERKGSREISTFKNNTTYPSIFTPEMYATVATLIEKGNSTAVWDESNLFAVSNDSIKFSLQPALLSAFRRIHLPGGQLVGEDVFIEVVKKHLLEGTLSEFNSDHYIDLARRQTADSRIKYKGYSDPTTSEKAALGLLSVGSVVADPDAHINLRKREIRRQRRFNTDINANCITEPLSNEGLPMYLTDAGIPVEKIDQSEAAVPTGDGDGYYMDIQKSDGSHVPLVTTSDYSSTYYVPPGVRYNALTLFKENKDYILQASSLFGVNELVSGDTGASALRPLYLILDLESMASESNNNPLVSRYSANYRVSDDQDEIDEHTLNNGLAVTRVNLDYRDSLYRYIMDTGRAKLSLNDINFKAIEDPKDYRGGVRIGRNMPFGLIITPVAGSKFNPLNGVSNLDSFGDTVSRSVRLTLDIDTSDK